MMESAKLPGDELDKGPHFAADVDPESLAWEEIEAGRFMPRRIRGSFRGRALG
jgi:hypothetical protein